jgi:hypothetical protein
MSRHQEWKMMHLLYRCSHTSSDGTRKILTEAELKSAGVHCEMDTWVALRNSGLVYWQGGEWGLTESALACLGHFTIAKAPDSGIDIRVDQGSLKVRQNSVSDWALASPTAPKDP